MLAVVGISPSITRTLLAELPGLGTLDRREIATHCGAVGTPQPHAACRMGWSPADPASGTTRL